MTPCIHSTPPAPLCESCRAEFDADPSAWEEWGEHSVGIANRRRLMEELATMEPGPVYGPEIPL